MEGRGGDGVLTKIQLTVYFYNVFCKLNVLHSFNMIFVPSFFCFYFCTQKEFFGG